MIDVRTKPSVNLVDGIYDGLPLYNVEDHVKQVRIPCRTKESGATLQIYRRSDLLSDFVWQRYEDKIEAPEEHSYSFGTFGTEFLILCFAERNKNKLTDAGIAHLIEVGCLLYRMRLVGIVADITIVTDKLTAKHLSKFVIDYKNVNLHLTELSGIGTFRDQYHAMKARLPSFVRPHTTLAIYVDPSFNVLRQCADWEANIRSALVTGFAAVSHDRSGNYSQSFIGFQPKRLQTIDWFVKWSDELTYDLTASSVDHMVRAADELAMRDSLVPLDVRYNNYIWSLYYRYQLGWELENLWIDDVCGISGRQSIWDLAEGVGYLPYVKAMVGVEDVNIETMKLEMNPYAA